MKQVSSSLFFPFHFGSSGGVSFRTTHTVEDNKNDAQTFLSLFCSFMELKLGTRQ